MKVTAQEGGTNILTYKYKRHRKATRVKDEIFGRQGDTGANTDIQHRIRMFKKEMVHKTR
jgi:hypothetical protein